MKLWAPGQLQGARWPRPAPHQAHRAPLPSRRVAVGAPLPRGARESSAGGSGDRSTGAATPAADDIKKQLDAEIAGIAIPMLVTLAADPLAGLVETALIGRLGAVELAGLASGLSVFATITKFANIPLISSTTTAVARAAAPPPAPAPPPTDSAGASQATTAGDSTSTTSATSASTSDSDAERVLSSSTASSRPRQGAVSAAASSALVLAAGVGLVEAVCVGAGASAALALWGVSSTSEFYLSALAFLQVRALGAPVQVLMLTLQGIFRGLADTRTPLVASLASNLLNMALAPVLIFVCGLGVRGAAAAIILSQLLPTCFLLWRLQGKVELKLMSRDCLRQLKTLGGPSAWLMLRSMGSIGTYAMATAAVVRAGTAHAAAHQVCFQLWQATTLTADALAVAVQSLLARTIASGDIPRSRQLVERCIKLAAGMGCCLAVTVGVFRNSLAQMFSTDPHVLSLIASVLPAVVVTQPINALAFLLDGALFGAGGFKFAAVSMTASALPALALIKLGTAQADPARTLQYVWLGLGLLMASRAVWITAAFLLKRGPFRELALPADGIMKGTRRGWVLSWGRHRVRLL